MTGSPLTQSDTARRWVRSRRVRAGAALAGLGIAATLGLSACAGAAQPGAAATVGDRKISVSELQTATQGVNESVGLKVGDKNAVPQSTVLTWLIIEPLVAAKAEELDVKLSDTELDTKVKGYFDQQVAQLQQQTNSVSKPPSPGPLSAEARRAWTGFLNLQGVLQKLGTSVKDDTDGTKAEKVIKDWWGTVLTDLNTKTVTVNPRYGTYQTPDVTGAKQVSDLLAIVKPPAGESFDSSNTPSGSPSGPQPEGSPSGEPNSQPSPTVTP